VVAVAPTAVGVTRVEHIMGMPIVVDVRDVDDAAALEPLFDWFRLVDRTFSTYIADSEISRLNRGELAVADAHPDVREVLDRCEELRVETNGFFDVRAQRVDYVDPSGLVKGWSVDRAAVIADDLGWRNYAINAGGDIRLRGGALPAAGWRVGIQHPKDRRQVAAVVSGDDLAVATSGAQARGQHVFDPHTHRPPLGVLSVTITGRDLATADAFATAAFAMGVHGPAWTARLRGYQALTMLADGRSLRTPGFPSLATDDGWLHDQRPVAEAEEGEERRDADRVGPAGVGDRQKADSRYERGGGQACAAGARP
jgi:thiamine biosynthesis lipoprotein